MFRFETSEFLYLLLLLPIMALVFFLLLKLKERSLSKLGDPEIIKRLFPNWSRRKEWIKTFLVLAGLGLAIIAWANPQWGARKQKVKAKRSDVIIALDISRSMMAEDISPNRLERAKRFTTSLIKELRGERIGLIYFAGSAYLQMPLTADYAAAELFVKSANTTLAGTQGTAIAEAIDLAQVTFGTENPTQKALILISDGENHDQESLEAAAIAQENGTFIFTVGVGTEEGAMIPYEVNGKRQYKVDNSGNPVKSALNVGLMQDVANAAGGKFYMMNQNPTLFNEIKAQINKLEKQEVEQRSLTDFVSYFQYFLFFGILFFILEYFLSNTSRKNWSLREKLNI